MLGYFAEHSCFKGSTFYICLFWNFSCFEGFIILSAVLFEVGVCCCLLVVFFFCFVALSMSALPMNAIYYSQLEHFGIHKFITQIP